MATGVTCGYCYSRWLPALCFKEYFSSTEARLSLCCLLIGCEFHPVRTGDTDLTQGTDPHVLLCTFCWDICKSVLVWAAPVEGLELSVLKKNKLFLQLFLDFVFFVGGKPASWLQKAEATVCFLMIFQLQTCWNLLVYEVMAIKGHVTSLNKHTPLHSEGLLCPSWA